MTKKITIPYFPIGLKYATPVIAGLGVYLAIAHYSIWAALLILLSVAILTSQYVTEIDLNKKVIHDYLEFMWIPLQNETKKFEQLDRIVVTKGSYSQTLNTRIQSRQIDWTDYTATLLMDNYNFIDLITRTEKRELLKALKEFSEFLKVGVEDRTTLQHYWVNMDRTFDE